MVKENHTQKTLIMSLALERRLREYTDRTKADERGNDVPPREQTTESAVICHALDVFLDNSAETA